MNLIKQLINFGLSDKEARVYTALLGLDIGIVQEITEKTGLNRSSIYVVLTSLQKRGLVETISNFGVTKYIAATPDQLLRLAQKNVQRYTFLKQNLNTLLPDLQIMHKGGTFKPKITIFEGENRLMECFEDISKVKKNAMRISPDLAIFDDTVGLMASEDSFAIKIESRDMANTIKTIFDLAREETNRLLKKPQTI